MVDDTIAPMNQRRITGFPVRVSSSIQGFDVSLGGPEGAKEWIAAEIQFWTNTSFITDGSGSGEPTDVSKYYRAELGTINPNDATALFRYLSGADRLKVVIGQSRFGEALIRLRHSDPHPAASLIAMLTTGLRHHVPRSEPWQTVRAVLMVSPTMLAVEDLAAISKHETRTRELTREFEEARTALSEQIQELYQQLQSDRAEASRLASEKQRDFANYTAEREADLTRIRDLYHKHVQTEAAATYWAARAKSAWLAGTLSLTAFIGLVMLPLALGYWHIEAIKAFVIEISQTSSGQLSLTPIVAITVPVLAYGWILRHVSRLFIQSFAQADDARYRQVMTMTFLGLTKDTTSGVTDAERGIIMNALFRRSPPNTSEDGPPNGLLDLVKAGRG